MGVERADVRAERTRACLKEEQTKGVCGWRTQG